VATRGSHGGPRAVAGPILSQAGADSAASRVEPLALHMEDIGQVLAKDRGGRSATATPPAWRSGAGGD